MKHTAEHIMEYIGVRIAALLLALLPLKAVRGAAWIAARLMFHRMRYRREEAMSRIMSALKCDKKRAREIAWGSMYRLCLMATESLRISKRAAEKLVHQPAGETFAAMYAAHRKRFGNQGLIIATPHMGCWEQVGLAGHAAGIPFFFMAKPQKNPLVDRFLNEKRKTFGAAAIPTNAKILREIISRLNNGEAMFILPDISEKKRKVMQVDFLGGTANLNAGAAMFARKTNVPVYPACPVFHDGQHRIIFAAEPLLPDESLEKEADYQRMMQQMFDFYNAQIRQHPEQYFWYNKRWILEPPRSRRKKR